MLRQLTDLEKQAVQWLAVQRNAAMVATPRSEREFDLTVNGEWFVSACLRMWRASYSELEYLDRALQMPVEVQWREFAQTLVLANTCPLFSHRLLSAVRGTWHAIAEDGTEAIDNAEALGMVLDADRIAMYGSRAAHRELEWLDEKFGAEVVEKRMAQQAAGLSTIIADNFGDNSSKARL